MQSRRINMVKNNREPSPETNLKYRLWKTLNRLRVRVGREEKRTKKTSCSGKYERLRNANEEMSKTTNSYCDAI